MPLIEKTEKETPLPETDLKNQKSFRRYSVAKQWLDILTVSILLTTIILLACCGVLKSDAVAGLIGAIVGYVLSEFKKRVSN